MIGIGGDELNTDYKQWKKVLAEPKVIVAVGAITFILTWTAGCLVSHLFAETLRSIVNFAASGGVGVQGKPVPEFNFNFANVFAPGSWLVPAKDPGVLAAIPFFFMVFWLIRMPKRLYTQRISFRDINTGLHGTARFATAEELVEESIAVPLNDEVYEGPPGVPQFHIAERDAGKLELAIPSTHPLQVSFDALAKRSNRQLPVFRKRGPENGYDLIDTNKTNGLVVAGTQSGKTQLFSYPFLDLIMRAEEKASVIVTDVKGDMAKNTRSEFEKYGWDVKIFNLVTPQYSIGYNPLSLIWEAYIAGDYDTAGLLCNTLSYALFHNANAKEPMWEEASIALTNALILAVCKLCKEHETPEKVTMYTVSVMLNELGQNPDENGETALDEFFSKLDKDDPAKLQYGTVAFSSGITRSGIFTGTMAKLKSYTQGQIGRLTSKNDLNILDMVDTNKKPVALFIVYPDYDSSNSSLVATMLDQISYVLSKHATMSKSSTLDRRVINLYEEVANFAMIPGLSHYMNVGLSRGLLYYLVIQSFSQLKDKYGDKGAEALMSACGNKYVILPDGKDDPAYFSSLLYKRTVIGATRHGDPMSFDKSYGESEQGRDLLNPEELAHLRKGEWVLIRDKQREDLDGQRTTAHPIFAKSDDRHEMLFAYEYLNPRFNHPQTFEELAESKLAAQANTNLEDLIVPREWLNLEGDYGDEASKQAADKRPKWAGGSVTMHTNTNQYVNMSQGPDGTRTMTPIGKGERTEPAPNVRFDPDGVDKPDEEEPTVTKVSSIQYENPIPVEKMIKQGALITVKQTVHKYLNSGQEKAFWNLKNFGEMQTYLAEHKDSLPSLYKALFETFKLEQVPE